MRNHSNSKSNILYKCAFAVAACAFAVDSASAVDIVGAIKTDNITDFRAALETADFNIDRTYGEYRRTALHYAVFYDSAEMVEDLLARGAQVEIFLARGADSRVLDYRRRTLLHLLLLR